MTTNYGPTSPPGAIPALGRFSRWSATRRGLRDQSLVLTMRPPTASTDMTDASGELPPLVTAYVEEVSAAAARASDRLRSRLVRRKKDLITQIHGESVRVVACYDTAGSRLPAALARFGGWVGQWRTEADGCRYRAQMIVERANQRLFRYWDGVCRVTEHTADHPTRLWSAPLRVKLDDSWLHPDTWLFAADGGPGTGTSTGSRVTARALAILLEQGGRDERRSTS